MSRRKVYTLQGLKRRLKALREEGLKVVFTNGCFDILHAGHVRYLAKARSLGDLLVVGLNSDASVKKIKGPKRPVVPEEERAELLSALEAVDFIFLFDDDTPIKVIDGVRPDILVKGADWKHGEIVGEDIVKASGGKVVRVKLVDGKSTTNIIEKVLELNR